MTDWSRAEEKNFQELVRRAEQQSREYYRRAGGKSGDPPASKPAPQGPNRGVTPPAPQGPNRGVTPPVPPQALPCLPAPNPAPQGQNSGVTPPQGPNCAVTAPAPQGPGCAASAPNRGGITSLLGGLGLDMETVLLVALLWLLWQEEADYRIILAIAYILLV